MNEKCSNCKHLGKSLDELQAIDEKNHTAYHAGKQWAKDPMYYCYRLRGQAWTTLNWRCYMWQKSS